jgi:hypothetical protein
MQFYKIKISPAFSNQNVPVVTIESICHKNGNLFDKYAATKQVWKTSCRHNKWPVAISGEWRQGWTTLF